MDANQLNQEVKGVDHRCDLSHLQTTNEMLLKLTEKAELKHPSIFLTSSEVIQLHGETWIRIYGRDRGNAVDYAGNDAWRFKFRLSSLVAVDTREPQVSTVEGKETFTAKKYIHLSNGTILLVIASDVAAWREFSQSI